MGRLKQLKPSLARMRPVVAYLERQPDQDRAERHPWRAWYGTARWRALAKKIKLRDLFTCKRCGLIDGNKRGVEADHRIPHRGDPVLFWDEDNLQTLCKSCHSSAKQKEEAAARRG